DDPVGELFQDGLPRSIVGRATEVLEAEPSAYISFVEQRKRIDRADLRLMAAKGGQFLRQPGADVAGEGRRLGFKPERIGCDAPKADLRGRPAFGLGGVNHEP